MRFFPLFGLGLIGVASLALNFIPALQAGALADQLPALPLPALVLLLMVNPFLMLLVASAIGAACAPRAGLRSLIATEAKGQRWQALRAAAPLALGLGLGLALVTVLADRALQPLMPEQWRLAADAAAQTWNWRALAVGLLYGGLTEEILLRWGLMSLFAWLGWKLFARRTASPGSTAMICAIVLAALLFGLGHLPAVASVAPLDAALALRTVLLNALAGCVFGWLYWRRNLETAMLAHAATHVGFALLHALGL